MPSLIVQFTKCSGIWLLTEASECITNMGPMLSEVQPAAAIASHAHILHLAPPASLASAAAELRLNLSRGRDGKGEFIR